MKKAFVTNVRLGRKAFFVPEDVTALKQHLGMVLAKRIMTYESQVACAREWDFAQSSVSDIARGKLDRYGVQTLFELAIKEGLVKGIYLKA